MKNEDSLLEKKQWRDYLFYVPISAVNNPILRGKTEIIIRHKGSKLGKDGYSEQRKEEINKIIEKLQKDSGVKK